LERHGEGEEVLVVAKDLADLQANPARRVACLLLAGDCALSQGNSSTAFLKYCRAHEIAVASNSAQLKLDCHLSLANYYQAKYEFELLIAECNKALDVMKSTANFSHELDFRVKLWKYSEKVDKTNLLTLIELSEQFGDFEVSIQVKKSLVELLITDSHFLMAVRYLEEIHSMYLLQRDRVAARETELFTGKTLFKAERFTEAKAWLSKASRPSSNQFEWVTVVEAETYLRLAELKLGTRGAAKRLSESKSKARSLGMYKLLDQLS
jgi:tetratricopeptide (TPR) repeat protein